MVLIKGNLQMPETLFRTISLIREEKKKEDSESCLASFERLIDPVILGTLFGLYKSQELPPIDKEEIIIGNSDKFNVDISDFAKKLNHFLFCLWVKKNGPPNESSDIMKYRESLYKFISKLLDADFYRNVLIPFYLQKAEESDPGEASFLYRLWNSGDVGLELTNHSPEFLALEFNSAQNDFIAEVLPSLSKGK